VDCNRPPARRHSGFRSGGIPPRAKGGGARHARHRTTAIGDTVNLAARLEQLTKEQSASLIASDVVVAKLGDAGGPAAPLGAVAVRSYPEPVPIWRLA
jgi:adenylate cyclase